LKIPKMPCVLAAVLALSALSAATNLKGTVKNGTTGKTAGGDDVVLLDMSQGMNETARTKADSQGHFSFKYEETGGPHMVRVLHQGVNYFPRAGIIPPGSSDTEVTVYDAASKVPGITLTVDMLRAQTEGNELQVKELWVVNNASEPPRTQMSDNAFEIVLPAGAQVDSSMASGPGGQPINSAPVPQSEKNKYAFIFPVRPGETRFQVNYHLPYPGKIKMGPAPQYPTNHVVVMLPKTMQFSGSAAGYQTMNGGDPEANIQVLTNVNPGQDVTFNLTGTGTIPEEQQTATGGGAAPSSGMAQRRGGPGGGLGAPEETPDPLHRYRGFILGGLAVALALGVFYVVTRPKPATAGGAVAAQQPASAPASDKHPPVQQAVSASPPPVSSAIAEPTSPNGNRLLDALKEELFQLEMERHQGKISGEEYEKAKAALDTTLARAAKRAGS